MKEIRIGANEASQRLDKFLRRYFPEAGGGFLYKQLRKKNIVLNGKKAEGRELLAEGDVITCWFSDETMEKFMGHADSKKNRPDLAEVQDIIYEDDGILILNKPAGMLSQGDGKGEESAVDFVRGYLIQSGQRTEDDFRLYRPSVVNRLDRNTSGILLAAKTLPAAQMLSAMLKDRTLRKYYLALAAGILPEDLEISGWLVRGNKNRVRILDHPELGAAEIRTVFEPAAFYHDRTEPGRSGCACTLLRAELLTGRTHQIRASLASIGHPLLGDVKYGDGTWNRKAAERWGLHRQFLHAEEIVFPDMGEKWPALSGRHFRAELPEDLRRVLEGVRRDMQ